jgi:vitamin B12 transporter
VGLLVSAPLPAQTPDPCAAAPNDCIILTHERIPPDILVAARVPRYADEIGQAVTTYDRDEIERRQTVSLADLLATTPGVNVSRNGSVGGFTGVRLRGAEAEQTLVVIDGVRVNDPSSPSGGFDFANLLAASVERIEVLRGPNSVPWGSQAIGGLVHIRTADPAGGADGDVSARAQAEYGYADQLYATAGVQGRSGGLSGSLNAGFLRTDGISSAAAGTERDGYRQIGGTARLGLAITDNVGVDLRGYYADSHLRFDGFSNAPPFGPADGPQSGETQELYGYAGAYADLAGGRIRNRIALTIADINRDTFDPDFPSAARGRSERYEYGVDARLSDRLRLAGGAERENSRFTDGFTVAETGITSVYAQAIVRPFTRLTLTGGVRYDDHDAFGDAVTAGADAALALGGTTLRGSYGEGFKAPTLFQLFSFFGNERLAPERARSFDLGVQQRLLGGSATFGATYFNRRTRNQIGFRSCTAAEQGTAGSICVDRPFGVYDNTARTRAEGVEVELALRPNDALSLSASLTLLEATDRTNGLDLARRPGETASVSADYRFPFGLSVGGTVLIVGDSFDDPGNFARLDGYALASLRAALPVGERLELYGRVENIANARYQTVAGYGTYGRAAYGGVRVRFD